MALDFSPSFTCFVNHGSASNLDNLDSQTWLYWINPYGLSDADRRLFYKASASVGGQMWIGDIVSGTNRIRYQRNRATQNTDVLAVNDTMALNTWQYIAVTDDDNVTPHMYRGTLTSAPTEVSYTIQQTGQGSPDDESGADMLIGGRSSSAHSCQCNLAFVAVYNKVLTLQQIIQHQFKLDAPIDTGCVLFSHYGFAGDASSNQPDWSGNGNNGTVTGATVAPHVPVAVFPFQTSMPYEVSAVGDLSVSESDTVTLADTAAMKGGDMGVTVTDADPYRYTGVRVVD